TLFPYTTLFRSPLKGKATGVDLRFVFVAIQFGDGAVEVQPEVQLEIDIAVIVLANLLERQGEVYVVADGAVVGRREAEEREPAVREEPLLGGGAAHALGPGLRLDRRIAGPVERDRK